MPETRAYKLNEQRQPGSRPGTLIYYYYGPDGRLTSQEVSEELFDALSDMDEKFYALERREEYHNVKHLKPSPHNHVFRPRKVEDLPDKKMADVLQQQEDSTDLLDARALFRSDDKRIYRMHFLEKLTQEEIAAALNRSQSYVSKRLAKIKETLESTSLQHDRSKKEAYAERQWEQFLERIARRLGMTAEEYVNGRFLPKIYKRLGKRYEDFRRKYQNVAVIEEDDPRPVSEQIVSIFGEGPEPRFRNPEFEDDDGKKGS